MSTESTPKYTIYKRKVSKEIGIEIHSVNEKDFKEELKKDINDNLTFAHAVEHPATNTKIFQQTYGIQIKQDKKKTPLFIKQGFMQRQAARTGVFTLHENLNIFTQAPATIIKACQHIFTETAKVFLTSSSSATLALNFIQQHPENPSQYKIITASRGDTSTYLVIKKNNQFTVMRLNKNCHATGLAKNNPDDPEVHFYDIDTQQFPQAEFFILQANAGLTTICEQKPLTESTYLADLLQRADKANKKSDDDLLLPKVAELAYQEGAKENISINLQPLNFSASKVNDAAPIAINFMTEEQKKFHVLDNSGPSSILIANQIENTVKNTVANINNFKNNKTPFNYSTQENINDNWLRNQNQQEQAQHFLFLREKTLVKIANIILTHRWQIKGGGGEKIFSSRIDKSIAKMGFFNPTPYTIVARHAKKIFAVIDGYLKEKEKLTHAGVQKGYPLPTSRALTSQMNEAYQALQAIVNEIDQQKSRYRTPDTANQYKDFVQLINSTSMHYSVELHPNVTISAYS